MAETEDVWAHPPSNLIRCGAAFCTGPSGPLERLCGRRCSNKVFLSLFLTGVSILLLVFAPQILNRETVALAFYGLLVFVWFAKVIVAIVHNWGHDLSWKIQLTCYAVLFAFLALPLALLL